jgi:hypothetical protein
MGANKEKETAKPRLTNGGINTGPSDQRPKRQMAKRQISENGTAAIPK